MLIASSSFFFLLTVNQHRPSASRPYFSLRPRQNRARRGGNLQAESRRGASRWKAAAAGGRCQSCGRRALGGGGWCGGRVTRSPSSSPSRRYAASSPAWSAMAWCNSPAPATSSSSPNSAPPPDPIQQCVLALPSHRSRPDRSMLLLIITAGNYVMRFEITNWASKWIGRSSLRVRSIFHFKFKNSKAAAACVSDWWNW